MLASCVNKQLSGDGKGECQVYGGTLKYKKIITHYHHHHQPQDVKNSRMQDGKIVEIELEDQLLVRGGGGGEGGGGAGGAV